MTDIPALLSRKEKFDIYDQKFEEVDELIPQIEDHLESIEVKFDILERNFQKKLEVISDLKVDKGEFYELLPKQHEIDLNINNLVKRQLEPVNENTDKKLNIFEERIVKLRSEFDIGKFERMIKVKTDQQEFNGFAEQQVFKQTALDNNFQLMVNDFKTF